MLGHTQILPIIIILIAIIALGVVCCVTYKIATPHYMRQKHFFVNTILPLLLFSITNMAILESGGILQIAAWYDYLHLNFMSPLRSAFPTIISICTTILGLLVIFALLYPKLSIYPLGAYLKKDKKYWVAFLVRNNGLWEIYDMHAELYAYIENSDGHKQIKTIPLEITSKYPILEWRYGHENQNSIMIETKNNVIRRNKIREQNIQLELLVKVVHPLSRITKVYKQVFALSDIHYGYFKNYRLRRFNIDTKEPIKKCLPKEILWRISNVLQYIEFLLLLVIIIGTCWYIIVPQTQEQIVCSIEKGYYIMSLSIAIIEVTRQIMRCPIKCKKVESSI